jgi:hypothetical protein
MTKMSAARRQRKGVPQPAPAGPQAPPERRVPAVNCAGCKFVDALNVQQPFCRRFPAQLVVVPRVNDADTGVRKFFPIVDLIYDWCGEHVPQSTPDKTVG